MPSAFPKTWNLGLKGPLEDIQGSPIREPLYSSGSQLGAILHTFRGTFGDVWRHLASSE